MDLGPIKSTEEIVGGGRATLVPRLRIAVIEGDDSGQTFTSTADRVVIGTHETADLVLHDAAVSRLHCEITLVDGRIRIRDLSSKNGTLVAGLAVADAASRGELLVTVGRTRLRIAPDADPAKVAISDRERVGIMVGRSTAIRRVFASIERAAACDVTVLVEGETGTGKEAVAESIHGESKRRDKPFMVVDCSAIPRDLLESELFGYEKGAFTGAGAARAGIFEAASGGTLLLDEVGELAPELQPKLLRVLERKELRRVGSTRNLAVDVRVIAATNRNLGAEVNAHRFRSDLYYRLAVLEIRLPPLRERQEDLPLLVEHLCERLGIEGRPETEWLRSPGFLEELSHHHWPGNVRELRNYLERSAALREAAPLPTSRADNLAPGVDLGRPLREAQQAWQAHFERQYVEEMLRRHGNNVSAAARASGMDRLTFYRLLWRLGLR